MTKPVVRKRERQAAQCVEFHSPNPTFGDLRLHIEYRRLSELKPPRRASRRHDDASIISIEASIKEHGFLVPILDRASSPDSLVGLPPRTSTLLLCL